MPTFLEQHADKVLGALSCFDRVLFRGYLPLESGWTMAEFLRAKGVDRLDLKRFLLEQAERLKKHSFKLAKEDGRPCQYLTGHVRKEQLAHEIARKDGIEHGLVCVFSVLETCRSFSIVWRNGKTFIRPAKRQCLFLYYYFLDRDLGLIHVKIQTWFPFRIQIYASLAPVEGHLEWLPPPNRSHPPA